MNRYIISPMVKHIQFLLIIILFTNFLLSQSVRSKCLLPTELKESSGIATINNGKSFWLHNDSGSDSEIFEVDSNCQLLRKVLISNALHSDWEAITADDNGNLYIGDFGNNVNSRMDQAIYIVENINQHTGSSITAKKIEYSYANQLQFPPSDLYKNFDMEAFFWFNDTLHLFSKNRTMPFTGYTYQYKIPAKEGRYAVYPSDSVITGTGNMNLYWVTDAAISPKQNKMILLSYDKAFLFYDFSGSQFFQGKRKDINFNHISQKEGITFGSEHELWISEEGGIQGSSLANLYTLSIAELFTDIHSYDTDRKRKKDCLIFDHGTMISFLQREKIEDVINLMGQKMKTTEFITPGMYMFKQNNQSFYFIFN
ncbi:MAG: SdiA-regulated domain-containing protein [Saprospiraceae bacterium]